METEFSSSLHNSPAKKRLLPDRFHKFPPHVSRLAYCWQKIILNNISAFLHLILGEYHKIHKQESDGSAFASEKFWTKQNIFYQVSESPVASVCSLMTKVKMRFCLTHEGITSIYTHVHWQTSICIIRPFDPVIQASFTLASTWVNFTQFWSLSIATECHWMWVGSLHNTAESPMKSFDFLSARFQ